MDVDLILRGYSLNLDHTSQTATPSSALGHPSYVPVARNSFGEIHAGDNAQVHCGNKYYYSPQERLTYVENAEFNSYEQDHTACHPATRIDLLHAIEEWAQRTDGKAIYWLSGMAGTGKSTVSYTIAEWLSMQRDSDSVNLGASFFFKRGEGDRASAKLFFPTIVRQLAQKNPSLAKCVDDVLQTDPDICKKSLGEQFDKLLRKPLQRVLATGHQPHRYIVVVDALDECDKEKDIQAVLQLWSSFSLTTKAYLRLFLTSRPELPIRLGFKRMDANIHEDVVLNEVPQSVIKHDIHAFLKDAFNDIREEYNLEPASSPLPDNWPGDRILQVLTDIAVPLFIMAATIYRFVHVTDESPRNRLETILQSRKSHLPQISQVYLPVLERIKVAFRTIQATEQPYCDFRTVVGAIITLAEPLSRKALACLLDTTLETVTLRLRPLHSVIQVPLDDKVLIRPLHLSFGEYLTSPEVRNHPYSIDKPATHDMLWRYCLRLLSGPNGLRENICSLSYPGQMRYNVSSAWISIHLPLAVSYACRYWVYHLQYSTTQIQDDDDIHNFLRQHFLHWLEALSLLDRLADAISYIEILKSSISPQMSAKISNFLEDARRFVLASRFIVNQAPLQLYSSAVIFSP